jgi:hypothetical protein
MALSIPIPQDVIDCIIAHLRKDPDTLKTCAVVSRSFLPPSRKHLFFFIRLFDSLSSQRLCDILSFEPELALLIQVLGIDDFKKPVWFATDQSVPKILRMTHRLKMLRLDDTSVGLGDHDHRCAPWDSFSTELQSALVECLDSPSLVEVFIDKIPRIPISMVTHFTHLKRMSLSFDIFDDAHWSPQSSLPMPFQVQAIELLYTFKELSTLETTLIHFLSMPRLRHLSISESSLGSLYVAEAFVRFLGASIKSISWVYRSFPQRELVGKLIFSILVDKR